MFLFLLVEILLKQSKRNKKNKSKLYTAHSVGTFSFVNVIYKRLRNLLHNIIKVTLFSVYVNYVYYV
jgi:hypothetical protein